uniref:Uncharacterized protein n=1 Tax=Arundo donax TaxID=35708 RepID=A0A0A8XX55_ARUDO
MRISRGKIMAAAGCRIYFPPWCLVADERDGSVALVLPSS